MFNVGDKVWLTIYPDDVYEEPHEVPGVIVGVFFEPGDPIQGVHVRGEDGVMHGSRCSQDCRVHEDEIAKRFICLDCSTDTSETHEYYMVHDEVWESVAGMFDGMLCIGCLEKRLKRTLTPADFTSAPVNNGMCKQSERLRDRMGLSREKAA